MLITLEAMIDEHNQVKLLQPAPGHGPRRALVTIFDDEAGWQSRFELLLARVHARIAGISPEEIEAEITAASDEVKHERRANRKS